MDSPFNCGCFFNDSDFLSTIFYGEVSSILLEVQDLRKVYKEFKLQDVTFSIEEGDIVGFVGPNGAGKSTTIKSILNLIERDSGSIKVFGLDNLTYENEIKDRIGFVFDSNYFYEDLCVKDVCKLLSSFYTRWDNHLLDYYLNLFQLPLAKKVKELSKGNKMKMAITIALSHDADFLIMDEATSGLDPFAREELLEILLEINQQKKKTFLFSSHIISDIEKVANRVIFINQGKIEMDDSKLEIKEKFLTVKGNLDTLTDKIMKDTIGYRKWQGYFQALIPQEKASQFSEFQIEKASLEDIIFFHIKGGVHETSFKLI